MTRIVVAGGSDIERAALCAVLHSDSSVETAALGPSLVHVVGSVTRLQPALVALVMGRKPSEAIEAARRIMGEIRVPSCWSPPFMSRMRTIFSRSPAHSQSSMCRSARPSSAAS
jgi:hypothetical protein